MNVISRISKTALIDVASTELKSINFAGKNSITAAKFKNQLVKTVVSLFTVCGCNASFTHKKHQRKNLLLFKKLYKA